MGEFKRKWCLMSFHAVMERSIIFFKQPHGCLIIRDGEVPARIKNVYLSLFTIMEENARFEGLLNCFICIFEFIIPIEVTKYYFKELQWSWQEVVWSCFPFTF